MTHVNNVANAIACDVAEIILGSVEAWDDFDKDKQRYIIFLIEQRIEQDREEVYEDIRSRI